MTPEIWNDLRVRMSNIRGDMVGQWQGDFDNPSIEHTVSMLSSAIRMWDEARPSDPPPETGNMVNPAL